MTIPSVCVSRALWRAVLGAGSMTLGVLLPAQRFQYDYGTPSATEIGTCLVRTPTTYLVGGPQGNDVAGVLTNPNGTTLASGRHAPVVGGLTLTPECARRTVTGGLIVAGEVQGGPAAGMEVFLAYYTPAGALWPFGVMGANRYALYSGEATGIRQGTRVVENGRGLGFAVITNVALAGGASRGVLFTTTPNGALNCWTSYTYNGAAIRFHDLCQDTDGSYVIVGSISPTNQVRRRTLVVRTNCGGAPIWSALYGPANPYEDVEQQAITRTANGDFAIWGHFSAMSTSTGSFLLEVNGTGAVVFHSHFPTIAGSRPTIVEAPNGDLLMNGRYGDDGLVLRTNSAGLAPVARTYGAPTPSVEELFQVLPTNDGGFVAAGSTQIVDTTASNFYLIKAEANGDTECNWQPLVVPQTFPPLVAANRQLQPTPGGQVTGLEMQPLVPATQETQLCFAPRSIAYTGDPVGTTGGLPTLGTSTPAVLGNAGFHVDASGLVPNGLAFVALSTVMATPGLPLAMFGGQPGSMLYLDPATLVTFPVMVDAIGEASVSFPIPGNPALVGLPLHWQGFDFDLALPFPLPLGNSQAMSLVIH